MAADKLDETDAYGDKFGQLMFALTTSTASAVEAAAKQDIWVHQAIDTMNYGQESSTDIQTADMMNMTT